MFGLEEIIKMNKRKDKSAEKIRQYFLPQYAKTSIQDYEKNETYTRKENS